MLVSSLDFVLWLVRVLNFPLSLLSRRVLALSFVPRLLPLIRRLLHPLVASSRVARGVASRGDAHCLDRRHCAILWAAMDQVAEAGSEDMTGMICAGRGML